MPLNAAPSAWAACLNPIADDRARRALAALFQRAVEDVHRLVDAGHEVVVILVSRRLSCLYEMLVSAGFDDLVSIDGCTVISDRALEGSVRLTTEHRVLLIDDAIVLGTTLVDTYDDLVDGLVTETGDPVSEAAVRDQIQVRVAMVDQGRRSNALLERLRLPVGETDEVCFLGTEQLQQVALEIARCLYQAGRPYFTDFPLVDELELTSATWDSLQASDRWKVFDVTPPTAFAGAERRSITFIPTPAVERLVRLRGRAEAMDLVEGIKVRVYAGAPDDEGRLNVRIVPMGLPGAMMVPRLRSVLTAIEDEIGVGLAWPEWKAQAQHRLLQMYTSSCVLAEFWEDLRAAGCEDELSSGRLDRVHVGCYFGEEDVPKVLDAFDRTISRYTATEVEPSHEPEPDVPLVPGSALASDRSVRQWTAGSARMVVAVEALRSDERHRERVQLLANAVPPSPGDGVTEVDPFWVHRVLTIFGEVDNNLELRQEGQIRTMTYQEYRAFRERGRTGATEERVVKMGITLRELCEGFAPLAAGEPHWSFAALSLAIDVGNDMGVIVPTTVCRGPMGPVFRQYRSGEMAYATKQPHADLKGIQPKDLEGRIDDYTEMVLSDVAASTSENIATVRERFVAANDAAAKMARSANQIAQAWIGSVTDLDDNVFVAYVTSRLDPGVSGPVRFQRSELPDSDAADIELGDTVIWTVFSDQDDVNGPLSTAEVRRLATHG